DRKIFSREIEKHIINHPNITLIRKEVRKIPDDGTVIIASGPLSSPAISDEIKRLCGTNNLFFFDAIAPIVEHSSINLNIAYEGSRYSKDPDDTGDYINCPFTKEEYETFVEALVNAERIPLKSFEEAINSGVTAGKKTFFEGCLPVEVLAARSVQSLAFGPMRPVGLIDPRTGKRPWAVLQLRQDNLSGSLYNLVGFQTNLLQKEQERVFRMIPGLENAQFIRYGQMHRNTYICAPGVLNASLQMINHPSVFFAGQLCGVEGYMGNIAAGLLAGINAARQIKGDDLLVLPKEMISGALFHYISTAEAKHFQPMKANFGILPPLSEKIRSKRERYVKYSERALENAALFFKENDC
ncbi:FADH(2)-oxidizing methylenetetrahydrofolate--tRNA-(uracil(54)-C(5))-methyltransferase TrmFO, partial [bacterium]|nr:FADH(2)-oxidizing methylenetetrahydrofolate--tRNA-(uracil(54)-C(5))-methyltransferase TrmFO [bacterium]